MATELKKVDMMDTKGDVILYVSVPINLGKLFRVIEEEPAIPVHVEDEKQAKEALQTISSELKTAIPPLTKRDVKLIRSEVDAVTKVTSSLFEGVGIPKLPADIELPQNINEICKVVFDAVLDARVKFKVDGYAGSVGRNFITCRNKDIKKDLAEVVTTVGEKIIESYKEPVKTE